MKKNDTVKFYFKKPKKNAGLKFGVIEKNGKKVEFDTCIDMIELLCEAQVEFAIPAMTYEAINKKMGVLPS